MPRSLSCLHDGQEITVEAALQLLEQHRNGPQAVFYCVECQRQVRPVREGGHVEAHFEHLYRNPYCRLSDPLPG